MFLVCTIVGDFFSSVLFASFLPSHCGFFLCALYFVGNFFCFSVLFGAFLCLVERVLSTRRRAQVGICEYFSYVYDALIAALLWFLLEEVLCEVVLERCCCHGMF